MNERENWLRAVEFRSPQWIPCSVGFGPLTWHTLREDLEEIVLRHPLLFPDFKPGNADYDHFDPVYTEGATFRDNWGCLWHNVQGGLEGQVIEHPLSDWSALKDYQPPDPMLYTERGTRDWEAARKSVAERKSQGVLTWGDGERLFDRMYFLRGFTDLMMDIATDDPHLPEFIDMLLQYELKVVNMWLEMGVDVVGFHTDIGTQKALMISPEKFRKYIKPFFKKIFRTCRDAGAHVTLSSDGNLTEIVDDLIDCGVSTHDPQLRASTLDGIVRAYRGKLCANVDLDRQMFAFCTPDDIRNQVREVVERMDAPVGGLMIAGSMWDSEIPLENVEALCTAVEDYCLKAKGVG